MDSPSLSQNLSHIHQALLKAIDFDIGKANLYRQTGFPTPQEMLGFVKFNRCLMAMFCSHHQAEELIAYPVLHKLIPSAPYDQLIVEHRHIETLIALIPDLLIDISGEAPNNSLRILGIVMRKISRVWKPHAELEELHFSSQALTPELQSEASRAINLAVYRYSIERHTPSFWVVPFLLFSFDGVDQTSDEVDFTSTLIDLLTPRLWDDRNSLPTFST